jgi:hypothetical protein
VTFLSDLPHFRIVETSLTSDGATLLGFFNHLNGVRAGRSWLYAGVDSSVIGDLTELERETRRAAFVAPFWNPASPVQMASDVPWIDGYWQPYQIAMIIDADAHWERTLFVPSPAQYFVNGNQIGYCPLGQALPEGAVATEVKAAAWDHEHCEIWHEKIGVGGDPYGYRNRENRWVCDACYRAYGEPRSLGFLIAA